MKEYQNVPSFAELCEEFADAFAVIDEFRNSLNVMRESEVEGVFTFSEIENNTVACDDALTAVSLLIAVVKSCGQRRRGIFTGNIVMEES